MSSSFSSREIPIHAPILGANQAKAEALRQRFRSQGMKSLNLISSPGAGKTTLLEKTIKGLSQFKIGVIEGDIATARDAERIVKAGAHAVQINTHGACHLDAAMVEKALDQLDGDYRFLFIENVGNLVCPAEFDLGEEAKVAILSVTEGADKPAKYPLVFLQSAVLLISKIDLLPYVDCDIQAMMADALLVNPNIEIFPLSAKTGEGMDAWFDWLRR
ncbi:MAG TPA: hydrogenase accessory protein HypB [Cyanobacteria bacterium UBA8530]|nr:hydrogenase accessory protein HypB [Cyanobacteria bacterium UBA8530]